MDSAVRGHAEDVVPMDPRPTLDVDNLRASKTLIKKRSRAIKHALPPKDDTVRKVLRRYRRRQARELDDSDPDPYDPSYIFYCLDTLPRS
jgi:hypothetical protein